MEYHSHSITTSKHIQVKMINNGTPHRYVLAKGDSLAGQSAEVVSIARTIWNGALLEGVKDITQYKTVLVDGVKTQVEVLPEEIVEPRPDSSWLVVDIKLWLDAQGVEYTSSMLKADLLALV